MKKILSLILACIMIITCFAACNDEIDDKSTDTTVEKVNETSNDETTEETSEEESGGETTDETTEEHAVMEKFKGKVCATFGASNTWYDGNAYNWGKEKGKVAVGYQSYMREELGMTVHNCGVSGLTMPQIVQHIKSLGFADSWGEIDYVTIKGGINDERHGVPIGEVKPKGSNFDTNTFIGSIQSAIEYLLEKNPDITIMLLTTTNAWIYAPAGFGPKNPQTEDSRIPEKWADAMKDIAEVYDLPVCDLYNEVPFNTVADRVKYLNDPEPPENTLYSTHPNTEGYKIVAKVIIEAFKKL